MSFDWTIKFGDILQLGVIVVGGLWALSRMQASNDTSTGVLSGTVSALATSLKKIDDGFDAMKREMAGLAKAVSTIAVAEQKIAAVNERLDDEKKEGAEFRHWLRTEIARLWLTIGQLSEEAKRQGETLGELQGRIAKK